MQFNSDEVICCEGYEVTSMPILTRKKLRISIDVNCKDDHPVHTAEVRASVYMR